MAETGLPAEVRELMLHHVPSMAHLEALLLLFRTRDRAWTDEALASDLHLERDAAGRVLRDLAASGLLGAEGDASALRYRFTASGPNLHALPMLEDTYNRLPVQLVRAVYERPPAPLQSFADAFRLRGGK